MVSLAEVFAFKIFVASACMWAIFEDFEVLGEQRVLALSPTHYWLYSVAGLQRWLSHTINDRSSVNMLVYAVRVCKGKLGSTRRREFLYALF